MQLATGMKHPAIFALPTEISHSPESRSPIPCAMRNGQSRRIESKETKVMPNYRRLWRPRGTYFFTVNLLERHGNDLLVREIDRLKAAVVDTARKRRFRVDAWVVLPDHLHCIATLPTGDCDFSDRWRRIRKQFSKGIPPIEYRSPTRQHRGERGIWQRRYWEHLIRDDADYRHHIDYIHYNPVKHGLIAHATDWPHSSLHRHIARASASHPTTPP
jgi:putative transposase